MVTAVGAVTGSVVGATFGPVDELLDVGFEHVPDLAAGLAVDSAGGSSSSTDLLLTGAMMLAPPPLSLSSSSDVDVVSRVYLWWRLTCPIGVSSSLSESDLMTLLYLDALAMMVSFGAIVTAAAGET